MRCSAVRELAGAYALGALSPSELAQVEAHLDRCARCRAELAGFADAASALAWAQPLVEPPPHLEQKLLARFRVEVAERRPDRRRLAAAGALLRWALAPAAALALLAGGLWGGQLLRSQSQEVAALRAAVEDLSEAYGQLLTETEALRGEVEAYREMERQFELTEELLARVAGSRGPGQGEGRALILALAAGPAAPEAVARVAVDAGAGDGCRVYLFAEGLPEPGPGERYEAWMEWKGGNVEPVGPLQRRGSGWWLETFVPGDPRNFGPFRVLAVRDGQKGQPGGPAEPGVWRGWPVLLQGDLWPASSW